MAVTASAFNYNLSLRAEFRRPARRIRSSTSGGPAVDDVGHRIVGQHERTVQNVRVVVDDVSLDLLNGAEVDFVEDLMGASFQIRNPNAASSCGCGNSFSI